MPTPTFRGISAVGNGPTTGGGVAVTAPTCSPDDMLVAFIAVSGSHAATPPDGWVQAADASPNPNDLILQAFTRRAITGDSGASFTFTADGYASGVIVAYQNVFGDEQVAVNASLIHFGESSPETLNAATVTTVRANQVVVECFAASVSRVSGVTATWSATPSTTRGSQGFDLSVGKIALVVADQPQTTAGTTPSRTATLSKGSEWAALTISFYPNLAPNAPTLQAPHDGSTVDVSQTQRFTWAFSDPDPGDSQSKAQFRYSGDGGLTWITVTQDTPTSYTDQPAGTFLDGTAYQWQVRTYDSFNVVGPWSASFHFTGATPPAGPTIINPTPDETVGSASVDVHWSYTDQEGYQVVLWPDDGSGSADTSGTPIFDTGQVTDTTTHDVVVPLDATAVTRHAQVSIEAGGLWSAFVDVRFTVAYDPPPKPVISLTTAESTISATVTTGAPGVGEIDAISVDIEISSDDGETWQRYATGLPINTVWTFWTPAAGHDYQFRAVAHSAAGTVTYSDPVDEAVIDMGTPPARPPLIPGGGP